MRRFRRRFSGVNWGLTGLILGAVGVLAGIVLLPTLLGWDDTKIELQVLIGVILFMFIVVLSYRR